jgi:hypothetical protein
MGSHKPVRLVMPSAYVMNVTFCCKQKKKSQHRVFHQDSALKILVITCMCAHTNYLFCCQNWRWCQFFCTKYHAKEKGKKPSWHTVLITVSIPMRASRYVRLAEAKAAQGSRASRVVLTGLCRYSFNDTHVSDPTLCFTQVANKPRHPTHTCQNCRITHRGQTQKNETDFELPFLEHANPSC